VPTRTTAPIGAPCWIDLATTDVEGAVAFYGALLGWVAVAPDPTRAGTITFALGDRAVAGCHPNPTDSGRPDGWSVYLASDDAHVAVTAARAHGGDVVEPPTVVGDFGVTALVLDSGGAAVGVWQPTGFDGFGVYGDRGAPRWFELHALDYERVVLFYREVFGWSGDALAVDEGEGVRLTTFGTTDERLAGIMDATAYLPEDRGPFWDVSFAVGDLERSLATLAELGGSVLTEPEGTPFGLSATATDPTGAAFGLVGDT
jgi:predicted enzyme related to lactoylglutathione lyase